MYVVFFFFLSFFFFLYIFFFVSLVGVSVCASHVAFSIRRCLRIGTVVEVFAGGGFFCSIPASSVAILTFRVEALQKS